METLASLRRLYNLRKPRLGCVVGWMFATALVGAAHSAERPLIGSSLGVASNFGHGEDLKSLGIATQNGISDFRDIIYWSLVEAEKSQFDFVLPRTSFPETISMLDGKMSLTVNWGNEIYDEGFTPYSPEGRAALGQFVVNVLDQFPAIKEVEIGNEFNGNNFVNGPVLEAKREDRAAAHFNILRDVYSAVKASHPEVKILGGAAHSVPAGFLWPVFELGGADFMDALVLHPYTTAPEQLKRQIDVLKRLKPVKNVPIQVTEFGEKDASVAPQYFHQMYCAMSLSGVERAVWYPLNVRGDGFEPIFKPQSDSLTDVGKAFIWAQQRYAGKPVRDASPDPYTYICAFGKRDWVIWGEPRTLKVSKGVQVYDAMGEEFAASAFQLSPSNPLLIVGQKPLKLGRDILLSSNSIIADSFHQFAYPRRKNVKPTEAAFEIYARRAGRKIALATMPGQDDRGTLWTPYLGNRYIRPVRVAAEHLVPGKAGEEDIEIVHLYTSDDDQMISVEATWTPGPESSDGISIEVLHDEAVLFSEKGVRNGMQFSLELQLDMGSELKFIVGPEGNAAGDIVDFRITLRRLETD